MRYAHNKGVVVVCAAGNNGRGQVGFPAAYKEAVAVAATQFDRTTTFYSNWGKEIDVAAPGGNTRVDQNNDGMPDGVLQNTIMIGKPDRNDYLLFMGTSMASPHVAGVAALVIQNGVTRPDAVERMLKSTANHPQGKSWDPHYGAGIVDASAALSRKRVTYSLLSIGLSGLLGLMLLGRLRGSGLTPIRPGLAAATGMLVGASGLFFLPALGLLSTGLPAWDVALFGAATPLGHSVLLPAALTVLLWSVPRLRGLLFGLALGVAGHLLFKAAANTVDVAWIPNLLALDQLWLLLNALLALALASVLARREQRSAKCGNAARLPLAATMTRLLALCLTVVLTACAAPATPPAPPRPEPAVRPEAAAPRQVELRLFVMSKCPHAVQAQQAVRQALDRLGPAVRLRVDYIAKEDGSGKLTAMHGPSEIRGNILQLCALRQPRQAALGFIDCLGRDLEQIPDNWEPCAEEAGIPAHKLMACYTAAEGTRLLQASIQRSAAAGVTGSPTILIAGRPYEGARDGRELLRTLCDALGQPPPPACAKLAPEVAVKLLVLNDRRCARCKTDTMVDALRGRFFRRLSVHTLDYGSAEGKELYRKLKLDGLPALLFDPGIERHHHHPSVARWLEPRGSYRLLLTKPRFDPTAEICDNGTDDTNNGKVDCDDDDCRHTVPCRREQPRRLDLFVMSQCPYAAQAVLAMQEVLKNFPGRLDFDLHYIADQHQGGFRALHGQSEVAENIRQLCAKKHYGKDNRYLGYVWCRFADYSSDDWQSCAVKGISARVIERCAAGSEGHRLLAEDIRVARALGITGSPTWLANNRHTFRGISAEQIKQGLCRRNPKLQGCGNTRSDSSTPAGSCGP